MVRHSELIIYVVEIMLITTDDRDGYIHESKWSRWSLSICILIFCRKSPRYYPVAQCLVVLDRGSFEAIIDNTSRLVASSLLMNGIYFQSRIRMSLGLDVLPGV